MEIEVRGVWHSILQVQKLPLMTREYEPVPVLFISQYG